jgi:dTDP-4-dehydrorhamnose 3,5-epimerase
VRFAPTKLAGAVVIEPEVHRDERGSFLEVFHARKFEAAGIAAAFVQDNHSCSRRGVLRGLHAQRRRPQGKLVRCMRGEIFDVVVDARRGSPTFGRWEAVLLSGDNFRLLYVPPGFFHGFCALSAEAEVEYKCTDFYDSDDQLGVVWNDPDLAIDWPIEQPILSAKDRALPRFAAVRDSLPVFAG